MFCAACANHNPAPRRHCAVCGAPLDSRPSAAAGRPVRPITAGRRARKWRLHRLLTILPLFLLLASGGFALSEYQAARASQASAYARGERALAAGDYAAAVLYFAEAGTYKDAGARREAIAAEIAPYRAVYLAGIDALRAGDYDAAIDAFVSVLRDLPAYEQAPAMLEDARRMRADALGSELDEAEATRDWLRAERLLGQLLADDPDNQELRDRSTRLARTHSPIVLARDGAIYTIGPDGRDERLVVDGVRGILPNWSPDRSRIAFFSSTGGRNGTYALFTVNPDGTDLRRLVQHVGIEGWAVWSPDGSRIAFTSLADFEIDGQEGIASIHVVEVASGIETDYTSAAYQYAVSPTWSPDGTRLAFITKRLYNPGAGGSRRVESALHILDTRTGEIVDVATNKLPYADYVTWSPADERLLVFSSESISNWNETAVRSIAMVAVATGMVEQVTDRSEMVSLPVWSPDGSRFAFSMGVDVVQIRSVYGATSWIDLPRSVSPGLTWSPDGSLLLAPAYDASAASMVIPLDGGAVADFSLTFDDGDGLYGPPQWSAANPLTPAGPPTIGGSALDNERLSASGFPPGRTAEAGIDTAAPPEAA